MPTTIPPDIKNTVTFVYRQGNDDKPIANGTGFFVSVRNESDPEKLQNVYLVTARHVLHDTSGKLYPKVFLRLNKLQGDAEFVPLDLQPQTGAPVFHVFEHPTDKSVDIAVLPAMPDRKVYDFKTVPAEMLATRESLSQLNIGEGSDVFFIGLFTAHIGQRRNYPISRFGRVALISDERIAWKDPNRQPELLELYLVETLSFGGNSGSPVFFYLGADREPGSINIGPPIVKLAGIIKGSFNEGQPIAFVSTASTPISNQNIGITAVVPAHLLHDILFSDELKKLRLKGH